MVGLEMSQISSPLAAIVVVRWQILANSLRSVRGRVDLFARIMMWIGFAGAGIGGAFGLAEQAADFISQGRAELLSILLWPTYIFWQLFPLLTSAFSENLESSNLLRFPITYKSYLFVRIVSGSLDTANALGVIWLIGIAIGIGFADKNLLLWSALSLLLFATLNILLARAIFAWLEHWLARRRTRELMAVLLFLMVISVQLIGPLLSDAVSSRLSSESQPSATRTSRILASLQRFSPPGLVAESIAGRSNGNPTAGTGALLLLACYAATFLWLLDVRSRAQYHGEYLAETSSPIFETDTRTLYTGWNVRGISGVTAAVLEKELRYLLRSGPVLLTFVTPVFMLLVLRGSAKGGVFLSASPEFAFSVVAAYSLLLLANLIYNLFGADGSGILLFYTSPASFRQIVAAKNLSHLALLMANLAIAGTAAVLLFSVPRFSIVAGTVAWILFAVPINLALGNLISVFSPKKLDWGTFGRQRASRLAILTSFAVQIFTVGAGVAVLFLARHLGNLWFATPMFLALATLSFAGYRLVLNRIDKLAMRHEDGMIFELAKT